MFEVKNLSAIWTGKTTPVFSNLTFSLPENQLTALCGINGSGKSTLLSTIAGIKPDNLKVCGEVFVDDINLFEIKSKEKAKRISYLIQTENNAWDISVKKLIEGGRFVHQKWYQNNSQQDEQIIEDVISALGLEDFKNRPISTLSGGELQRVRIARSLAQQTKYIFLDEPLSGLDLNHQKDLLLLLKNLCTQGKTVFLSIHDINFASIYADNMLLLKKDRTGCFMGKSEKMMEYGVLSEVFGEGFEIYNHPVAGAKQIF